MIYQEMYDSIHKQHYHTIDEIDEAMLGFIFDNLEIKLIKTDINTIKVQLLIKNQIVSEDSANF